MDYIDLKYALAKKGYSLTRLAKELGLYGSQSIQQVLIRKYISARVEKRVSEITGIPLEELFPDRYRSTKRQPPAGGKKIKKKKIHNTDRTRNINSEGHMVNGEMFESGGALTKSFRKLDPQKVLKLKQQGLSNNQIAQRLGVTQGAVYHALRKGGAFTKQTPNDD